MTNKSTAPAPHGLWSEAAMAEALWLRRMLTRDDQRRIAEVERIWYLAFPLTM